MKLFGRNQNNKGIQNLSLAQAFFEKNDRKQASIYAEKAIRELSKLKKSSPVDLSWAFCMLGGAEMGLGNLEKAEGAFQKSISLMLNARNFFSVDQIISTYLGMEKLQFKMQNYKASKEALLHTIDLIFPLSPDDRHTNIYMYLARNYEELRDYAGAVVYFEKYLMALSAFKGKGQSNYHGVSQHKDRLKASLAAQFLGFPEPFISIKYENGGAAMIDIQYAKYLISALPNPSQVSLTKLVSGTRKITLVQAVVVNNRLEWKPIFELEDTDLIENFVSNLNISENQSIGHMMGNGQHKIVLEKDDTYSIEIEILCANTIRLVNNWKHDAQLENPSFLKEWLRQNGVEIE